MKTTEEKIAVMQGFLDGRKVECKSIHIIEDSYIDIDNPSWNWNANDYRLKEEPKLVPFLFEDDLLGMKIKTKDSSLKYLITGQHKSGVYLNSALKVTPVKYEDLLSDYLQLDGSPCGKTL